MRIGTIMELSIVMRLRIAAAMVVGAVIIGFIGWPMVRPVDGAGAVSLFDGQVSIVDGLILAALAYVSGFAAYFAASPCGKAIAPLAVPTGLAVWTFRSGNVETLLRSNRQVAEKLAAYNSFRIEILLWLGLIGMGYLGILTAQKIKASRLPEEIAEAEKDTSKNRSLRIAMAIVATTVVAMFCIGIFAQDIRRFDAEIDFVIGQPGRGQIAFAVIASFALGAFLCKNFLNTPPIVSTIASLALVQVAVLISTNNLEHMSANWPVSFFPRAISAILPVQIAAFSAIGSVLGYWIAIRYAYWREHEK